MRLFLCLLWASIFSTIIDAQQLIPSSDEFNRACSLSDWNSVNDDECWNASHLETIDIDSIHSGNLTLIPWTTAWYGNYRSNLHYKEVSGNFSYTIRVSATNKEANGIPSSNYSLAGAMVRAPIELTDCNSGWVTGQENYVFLSLGFAAGSNPPHFEVKSTTNSNSNLNITSIDTASAIIKLLRIDNAIIAMHQVDGANWQIRQRYDRTDFPDTLLVGNVAYTDWDKVNDYTTPFHNRNTINALLDPDPASSQDTFQPDIMARFDFARFESLTIPPELQGLDFASTSAVSDSAILAYYSYIPQSTDRTGWKIWKGNTNDWGDASNWENNSLPMIGDSIIIPNCQCPSVIFPTIVEGNHMISSLVIEEGGQLNITDGAILDVNITGVASIFNNAGTIINSGSLIVRNMESKQVDNTGNITTTNTGNTTFQEH